MARRCKISRDALMKKLLTTLIAFFFLIESAFAQSISGGSDFPPCSICGDGKVVSNPNGLVIAPGFEPVSCGAYEKTGKDGFFDPATCEVAFIFAGDCGCRREHRHMYRNAVLIAGITLGIVALLVIVFVVGCRAYRKRRDKSTGDTAAAAATTIDPTVTATTIGSASTDFHTPVGNPHTSGMQIEMVNAQPIPMDASAPPAPPAVAYDDGHTLQVYAPQGRLGVVIDRSIDGLPTVSVMTETSVVSGLMRVGDKILEVDDENVTGMTPAQVSGLLNRKRNNPKRKLMILRTGTEV